MDRKPRGLAALSPERRREIASLGGQASCRKMSVERRRAIASLGGRAMHRNGRHGNEWTREQAIEYGRKGGLTPRTMQQEAS